MTASYSIPYKAFSQDTAAIREELIGVFEKVLDSGRYVLGPEVSAFEKEFATYCGTKWAAGTGSGTCALHLVMQGLCFKEGDEVITAPNSFIASASSIALAGGRPVFVDIRTDGNIDPALIEDAITSRTRAIVPVHLTGRPARMPEIMEIARRHNLFVLEDAAQAVGARIDGRPVGGWGDAACFSLHPLKNLHAFGDGGVVTTNSKGVLDLLIKARNHGLVNRDRCDFWSFNSRLDELQGAFLRVQLPHLDSFTEALRRLAFRYNDLLRSYVDVPDEGPGEHCVYQTYVVQADRRDELQHHLRVNGVEALVHYATPIHLQPAARSLGYSATDFPVTMKHVERILSLPLYPSLLPMQQERVAELIADFYNSGSSH